MIAVFYAVVARSSFPLVRDAPGMQRLLGIARIAVALIAIVRTGLIVESSRFFYGSSDTVTGLVNAETQLALVQLGLLLLLAIGLLTPVVTLALLVTYQPMDASLGTSNLGTAVLLTLLILLLLSNAGLRCSVDSLLCRRFSGRRPARWLGRLYGVIGAPDARALTVYLFGAFVAYGLVSFGAILHHFDDPYWRGGDTVEMLFTNAFLSRVWEPARALQESAPWLMAANSQIAIVGQTIFQLAMIPLVFLRWGMRFVAVWGLLFVLLSVAVLQISYLPFLELVLWPLLFLRPTACARAAILYDDRCNLCRGVVRALRLADPFGRYSLRPISARSPRRRARGERGGGAGGSSRHRRRAPAAGL